MTLQWQALEARSSRPLAVASQRLNRLLELAPAGEGYRAKYLCKPSSVSLLSFDLGEAPDGLETGGDAALAAVAAVVAAAGDDPRMSPENDTTGAAVRCESRGAEESHR